MSWREIQLGDAFSIKHGFAFKSKYFREEGQHIVLTPGNFYELGGFRSRPGKDRFYAVEPPEDFILAPNDLVIAMTEQGEGLLGSSAIVPTEGSYLHNQRIGLIENLDETKLDKGFLYRLFNTPHVRGHIRASASGTKVRHTAPKRIYQIKVKVPPVSAQRRISEILSAYDDLIETNRRRIALLEEAARLLYREWFVHFRFPGHEQVPLVDGIPASWERKTLGDVVENHDRHRKPISVIEREKRRGRYPYYGAASILDYIDGYIFDGRYLLMGEDGTVITSRGTPMLQLVDGQFWANNHAHILSGTIVSTEFAYCALSEYRIQGHITGVAQPKITQQNMNRIPIVLPPTNLQCEFQKSVCLVIDQWFLLERCNQKLAQARDLLLPRLMNGEIAV